MGGSTTSADLYGGRMDFSVFFIPLGLIAAVVISHLADKEERRRIEEEIRLPDDCLIDDEDGA